LTEKKIEQLEQPKRPAMPATVKKSADEIELWVEALYWGVRWMIEELTRDKSRMEAAEKFLLETYGAKSNTSRTNALTFASSTRR
jgi:hypothetical protein